MKRLKFNSAVIPLIEKGIVTSTFRVNDDKQIELDDQIECINRDNSEVFGYIIAREIILKKISDIDDHDKKGYKISNSKNDLITDLRQFYGDKVKTGTPIKIIRFKFSKKPHVDKKVVKKLTSITEAKLFTDGGSRGNPGPSASGFVLTNMDDKVLINDGVYLGITTNNQAEYKALKFGLEKAIELNIKTLHVFMDSLLVVNQINGVFKVRNRDLWPIYDSIKKLSQNFVEVSFSHVPRAYNKLADSEVNKTLDANV